MHNRCVIPRLLIRSIELVNVRVALQDIQLEAQVRVRSNDIVKMSVVGFTAIG